MALQPSLLRPSKLSCLPSLAKRFSTFPVAAHRSSKQSLRAKHADIPEYPYGPSLWYKQSNFGLYGGQKIRSGNNVSKDSETKTRRKWRPNVRNRTLFSHALNKYIQIKVTTRVLRTIDKSGGLDEYLIKDKAGRIKELGMKGWELRWQVMNSPWWKNRCTTEYERMMLQDLIPEIEAIERAVFINAGKGGSVGEDEPRSTAVEAMATIKESLPMKRNLRTPNAP
ncbi:hypothetical protein FKW77_001234 [Venturia effusa]|uniref:Large ribosomal subunit protein bL28m n=1 Tax=Venturia effusa TaxID=50376 RepID=A0A517LDB5_9PEZI|nr:hypothetical protein FKW77_001234 [Venturia effusa]